MERVWREGEEMDGVKERVGREGECEDVEAGRGEGIGGVRKEGEGKRKGMEGMTGSLRFHNVDTPMMSGHVGLATTVWDRCSVKPEIHQNTCHQLVAWHSGRTSVSDWRTFPVLRLTCS